MESRILELRFKIKVHHLRSRYISEAHLSQETARNPTQNFYECRNAQH
jgi:hypothetical protein